MNNKKELQKFCFFAAGTTLIFLGIILFAASAAAATCDLPDGSLVQDCETVNGVNGEQANTLIHWNAPTVRQSGKQLKPEEILKTRIYFEQKNNNHWTNYDLINPLDTSLYIYKVPEIYSVLVTVFDTNSDEGIGSDPIVYEFKDSTTEPPIDPPIEPPTNPNPPILIIENATVHIFTNDEVQP